MLPRMLFFQNLKNLKIIFVILQNANVARLRLDELTDSMQFQSLSDGQLQNSFHDLENQLSELKNFQISW